MAVTPMTVRVPVTIPLFLQTPDGLFVEVGTIEQTVDVAVEVSR